MLIYFTDATSGGKLAINPKRVVVVFTLPEGDMKGKTAIGLTTGNCIVDESRLDVVGALQSHLD